MGTMKTEERGSSVVLTKGLVRSHVFKALQNTSSVDVIQIMGEGVPLSSLTFIAILVHLKYLAFKKMFYDALSHPVKGHGESFSIYRVFINQKRNV